MHTHTHTHTHSHCLRRVLANHHVDKAGRKSRKQCLQICPQPSDVFVMWGITGHSSSSGYTSIIRNKHWSHARIQRIWQWFGQAHNQAAIKGFQKQYTSHKIRGENVSCKDETWQKDLKGCLPLLTRRPDCIKDRQVMTDHLARWSNNHVHHHHCLFDTECHCHIPHRNAAKKKTKTSACLPRLRWCHMGPLCTEKVIK